MPYLIIAILGLGVLTYAENQPPKQPVQSVQLQEVVAEQNKEPDMSITADQMIDTYYTSIYDDFQYFQKADKKFRGKKIEVTGKVVTVHTDHIKLMGYKDKKWRHMELYFKMQNADVKLGDKITVQGRCVGVDEVGLFVYFNDCFLKG